METQEVECPFHTLEMTTPAADLVDETGFLNLLEKNYKKVLKTCHPSRIWCNDERHEKEELCKRVQEAYRFLRDPKLRQYFFGNATDIEISTSWRRARVARNLIDNYLERIDTVQPESLIYKKASMNKIPAVGPLYKTTNLKRQFKQRTGKDVKSRYKALSQKATNIENLETTENADGTSDNITQVCENQRSEQDEVQVEMIVHFIAGGIRNQVPFGEDGM